jgi:hypothetical protein
LTGLNLQAADTVVNLELPWNPAVLEQRIARVHRMGQSNPVRVVNLVTRGTIEERVLRTLEAKQGLFAGVFDSDEDEIAFEAVNRTGFLDAVREMIGEPRSEAVPPPAPILPAEPDLETANARSELWRAGAQMVEALSRLLAAGATTAEVPDPELRNRLRRGLSDLLRRLGE